MRYLQILTKLSQPPETNLRAGGAGGALLATKDPGLTAGAQLTEFTPIPWALLIFWTSQLLSPIITRYYTDSYVTH